MTAEPISPVAGTGSIVRPAEEVRRWEIIQVDLNGDEKRHLAEWYKRHGLKVRELKVIPLSPEEIKAWSAARLTGEQIRQKIRQKVEETEAQEDPWEHFDASLEIDGKNCLRVRFGSERNFRGGDHCDDCNVLRGSLHYFHCEMEECPKCGRQLVQCGCVPGLLARIRGRS